MKKFLEYLKNNLVIEAGVYGILCLSAFFIREQFEFKPQMMIIINLVIMMILARIFFNAVRKRSIRWNFINCLLSLSFILNRFYDKDRFKTTFHFEFSLFVILLCFGTALIILYPLLKTCISKIFSLFEKWDNTEGAINQEFVSNTKAKSQEIDKHEQQSDMDNIEESNNISEPNPDIKKKVKNERSTYTILMSVYFLVFIMILFVLLIVWSINKPVDIMENINIRNLPTIILSLAVLIMFVAFCSGITISLIIKWIQIIEAVLKNQHKGELYFVYACALFFFSQYIFINYPYTTDDVADLLVNGKLFTFPLILSVLIPVFLIFAENIVTFLKQNEDARDVLDTCKDKTIKIAENIVDALLTFVEFVTSDYLKTMIDLTKEENLDDEEHGDGNGKGNGNGEIKEK